MHIHTNSSQSKQLFNATWEQIAAEIHCVYAPISGDGRLIVNENGEGVGTIEFTPFSPHTNQGIDHYYSFSHDERLHQYGHQLYSISKLGIKKEYRGSQTGYFQTLMELIIDHHRDNNVDYYIASLNKSVYRALMHLYQPKIETLHPAIPIGKISIYPIVLHMEETISRLENQKWYSDKYMIAK